MHRTPPKIELPVLQDVPNCRKWAAKLGTRASYKAPAPPLWTRRLDAVFLHPVAGPLIFLAVVIAVFQSIFSWAQPAHGRAAASRRRFRSMDGSAFCRIRLGALC